MSKTSIFKYLTSYKTNSIIVKNFVTILFIVIIPMTILFMGLYISHFRSSEQQLSASYRQQISNTATSFDNIYAEMKLYIYILSQNPDIIDFMSAEEPEVYTKADYNSIMSTSNLFYKYIESIYLYSAENRYIISGAYNDTIEKFPDKSWLSSYSHTYSNELIVTPRKISDKYPYCLSFMLPVFNELGKNIGAIIVNLNVETLLNVILGTQSSSNELYILNEYKKLVLSTNIERMYDAFNQYAYVYERMEEANSSGAFVETLDSRQSSLSYIYISSPESQTGRSGFISIIIIFLSLVTTMLVSILLTVRTFKPIQSIIESIGEDFDSEKALSIDNELSFIINNINTTIQDKRLTEIELEHRIALLNNAYTSALQAQINPHFLYNTLETINFMAYRHFKAPNDISDITISLSKMLRISLDGENKIVTLSEEAEHLMLYVKILQLRYPEKFKLETDFPQELSGCRVVKLMLQPLVENAFQHGIRPSGRFGTIKVRAFSENDKLKIEVSDDGAGMDKQTLTSVQKILASDIYITSKHIGVNNVNRRIKLLFGTEYGLAVESIEGNGTHFTITLPLNNHNDASTTNERNNETL